MVKSLILCEGGEDLGLLTKFLAVKLAQKGAVDVRKLKNNKTDFFNVDSYRLVIQQLHNKQYKKVLFIVDADHISNDAVYGGYSNTESKLRSIISELGFDGIADIFIACDPLTKEGTMEHLLLSTTESSKRACVEKLINCINGYTPYSNKKIVYNGYSNIFPDTPYNFDHTHFDELISKLTWLTT